MIAMTTRISRQLTGSRALVSERRERECLAAVFRHNDGERAAEALGIKHHTLRGYLHDLYAELGVSGRGARDAAAMRLGWLVVPAFGVEDTPEPTVNEREEET